MSESKHQPQRNAGRQARPGDPPGTAVAVLPPKEPERSLTYHTSSTLNTNPLGGQTVQDSGAPGGVLVEGHTTNDFDGRIPIYNGTFDILSIDGGGARGMIPAVILEEVERRSGRRISSLFDRICGTSTGSILACALAAPESAGSTEPMFRAREIVEIYRTLGSEVFSRGSFNDTVIEPMDFLLGPPLNLPWIALHLVEAFESVVDVWARLNAPLHDIHKLAYLLHGYLGDLRMDDALTELFVYAYDIGSRTPEVIGSLESSIPGTRDYSRYRMYQAAAASSAAVPFFAPYPVWRNPVEPIEAIMPPPGTNFYPYYPGTGDSFDLVDGGNAGLGNPALFAAFEESEASVGRSRTVLSLGTGHFSQPVSSSAAGWGFAQWLGEGGELLKCIFDGEADVADMVLRQLDGPGLSYFRWQPNIPESLAFLDEGSVTDMNALEDVARTFIAENDEEIDLVIEILERRSMVAI